jgi:hypothetical protein
VRGRYVATEAEIVSIRDRKVVGQPCRACKAGPATNWHHLVPKTSPHLGDDVAENAVGLGGTGTTGCHGILSTGSRGKDCGGVVRTYDEIVRMLGANLTPAERAYVSLKMGAFWLERRYPRG